MNKRHFSIRNLLDGFVQANKIIHGMKNLGAIVSGDSPDVWLGPSYEIRASLQSAVTEASLRSDAILISVVPTQQSLSFEVKCLLPDSDEGDWNLPSDLPVRHLDQEIPGYQTVAINFDVEATPVGMAKARNLSKIVHVVRHSPIDTYVLEGQLKMLGLKLRVMSPAERETVTEPADLVFVDPKVDSQTLTVASGHKFVGLGEDSELAATLSNPGMIAELMEHIPAEIVSSILVVDDSLPSLHTTSAILETMGFEVSTSETGKEAIEFLENSSVEVLLTDINLEDMSGLEIIRQAKAKGQASRIIAMTGETDREVHKEIFSVGADQLIIKPARKAGLIKAIKNSQLRLISTEE